MSNITRKWSGKTTGNMGVKDKRKMKILELFPDFQVKKAEIEVKYSHSLVFSRDWGQGSSQTLKYEEA